MAKAKSTKPKSAKGRAKPRSYVTFLLDRSGSMGDIRAETIEGFNTYLSGLQAEKHADIRFTFLTFDSQSLDKLYVATPVAEVPLLTFATFIPRGGTPLIDASYSTIKAVEEAVAREEKKPRVVVCIQTDGEENQSQAHTWADLSALVKAKQEEGWQFNFLGAGIDAYKQAALTGISASGTMSYGVGMAETQSAFRSYASNTVNYSSGMAASMDFVDDQKAAAGDLYDPDAAKKKEHKVHRGVLSRGK